ncbi:protein kinase domain-containing protein [Natronincola ferrireducens]|uniref:Serine/threonine protein kinase n=1 Tax=Natronincola ferrireducens TaxID=393762 RepID=A0A1G9FGV0_9FIRM|nr:protein kinase [Natronincola ferrireducens]SDK87556.1 serine/threonine protein kinase [Natronincola ferrireducens]
MAISYVKHATVIEGKWNKNKYKVKKILGEGGIATVYLVEDINKGRDYALKITKDSISINREYELLKKFHKVDIIVNAYEIDDWLVEQETYYFIVLEYIEGTTLKMYCKKNKLEKNIIIGIILILLKGLEAFHSEEYIVGDLKPENIMIDKARRKIKLIDLGGVVKKGDAIKEFTPQYDRASWGCGKRISEDSYDIFSSMMIFVKLLLQEELYPRKQSIQDIINKLKKMDLEGCVEAYISEGLIKNEKPLLYFIRRLKVLYDREIIKQQYKKSYLRNKRVNHMLTISVIFFVVTMIFILVD